MIDRCAPLPSVEERRAALALGCSHEHSEAGETREMLREAWTELNATREAVVVLGCVAHLAMNTPRPPIVPDGHVAEARVLGAMLLGRATAGDVRALRPSFFEAPWHEIIFCGILSVLEVASRAGLRLPPPGPQRRRQVSALLRRSIDVGPRPTLDERYEAESVARVMRELPWPAKCPRDAIDLVGAIGRWRQR